MKRKISVLLIIITTLLLVSVSHIISAEDTAAPPTVSCVTVKNTLSGVAVNWVCDEKPVSCKILRSIEGSEYTVLTETSDKPFIDSTAISGTNYSYQVIPCTANGDGTCLAEAGLMRLDQPEIISAENTCDGVSISWKKVEGATSYTLYFKSEDDTAWKSAGTFGDVNCVFHKKAPGGKNCTYTLIARNGSNKSSFNTQGKSIFVLHTPEIKAISSVTSGIYLRWSKSEGAESYMIYRRAAGKKWSCLTTVSADKTSYTDTTMNPGYTYAYTVQAINENGSSAYTPGMTYRYIPVNDITSIKGNEKGLSVSWKASPYANGYKLYRKAEGENSWKRIALLSGQNNTSFTDTKVEHGKIYSYTLISVCSKYQSTFNKNGLSYMYLAVPEVTLALKAETGYGINWEKTDGATHYYIYRKENLSDKWIKLGRTSNKDFYHDKSADRNKSYYYCVRSGVNSTYFSGYGEGVLTSRIDPNGKMVALTYDDGPHNTYTNKILDVLEKYDARATFFVVGSRIDSASEPLIRAVELGCEIGNHTYTHINLPSYSNSSITNEMTKTDNAVKKYTGVTPVIMRPPGGATSSRVLSIIGKPVIMWSVDTRDWEHRSSARTVSHIKNNVYDGAIILMHDLYSATASATETIVPWLIKNGYQLVTVSELMQYRDITMKNGSVYRSAKP